MQITLWVLSFIVILAGAGIVYQLAGSNRDRRRYSGAGRWVTIGKGRCIYIREEGLRQNGASRPTVLFESGIGATSLNWRQVQQAVSQFAATASYDRIGMGFSSPSRTARTPVNIARELHDLLEEAGVKPPYVLVGHSFGGLVMRRYALLFPKEVAGVVLVDPMRCEDWPPLDPSKQAQIELGKRLIRYATPFAFCGVTRLAVTSAFRHAGKMKGRFSTPAKQGGRHVIGRITHEVRKMPREVWPVVAAHWSRPGFYAGMRSHIESIPDTVREMHIAEPIRDIPITVLTPEKSKPLSETCLNQIGDNVRQVIAHASEHWIHLDEPELVVNSIQTMVTNATAAKLAATV
jgi:pimeloyl-ACP methyl ester carboxylesterase